MHQKLLYGLSLIAVVCGVGYLNQEPLGEFAQANVHGALLEGLHFKPAVSGDHREQLSPALLLPNEELTPYPPSEQGLIKVAYQASPQTQAQAQANAQAHTMRPQRSGQISLSDLTLSNMEALADETPVDDVRVLLVPDRETTIASTSAGRLTALKSQLGQRFKKGELLAAFDCEERQAQVDMAKAEFVGTVEQHEAKIKMQGLDQASDVEVAMAASESNKAKANLKLNVTLAKACNIYAPWAGRVSQAHVKKHMIVAPGEPLLDIVNTGRLKIKINVPSKQITSIKVGKRFNVAIDETGRLYRARISAINSKVDPVSQTVEVEATLTKHYQKLLAGMSGTADLIGGKNAKKNAAKLAAK